MRYFFILCLLVAVSCTKKDTVNDTIVGTWEHREHYSDIGNGTGDWSEVPVADRKAISFGANGSLSAPGHGYLSHYNRYEVLSSERLRLYRTSGSYIEIVYALDNQLTLYYLCIERCGDRFKRTK